MKFSIITAVRNGETTIADTLNAVASQDYSSIEHIVVDGASHDKTVDVVRSCGARVAKLISEPDSGVYEAFNKGLCAATGDVVGYLNSGDVYTSSRCISAVAEIFSNEADVHAVFGDVLLVEPQSGRLVRIYRADEFSPRRIGNGFMPGHPSLFVRRSSYLQYGRYDESYRIAGDFELVARFLGNHQLKYRYLCNSLVKMAAGGLSTSSVKSNWIITREMRRACRANGITTGWIRLLSRFPLKAYKMRSSRAFLPPP